MDYASMKRALVLQLVFLFMAMPILIALVASVVWYTETASAVAKPKPLAVVLDFGSNNFMNASFEERFVSALTNISVLHPKALVIKIDSDGGVGYKLDNKTWLWLPQIIGEELQLFSKASNATTYWYVPHECISGCFVASLYSDYTMTDIGATLKFNHTEAEVGRTTWDWLGHIITYSHSKNVCNNQCVMDFEDFIEVAHLSQYELKTIAA